MNPSLRSSRAQQGFTLIELLVVIGILVVLMGLLFPVANGVKDQANKVKAKNDLVQIVNATKAYYAEYGRYPIDTTSDSVQTFTFNTLSASYADYGPTGNTGDKLYDILRYNLTGGNQSRVQALNPRGIVFIEPPLVKDRTNPKGGINPTNGRWYDPWGGRTAGDTATGQYIVRIDASYVNGVNNPYDSSNPVSTGVIAWCLGKNHIQDNPTTGDDVVSWQ